MVMQMSGGSSVLSVPDEHLPGLIALVLFAPETGMALSGLRALSTRLSGGLTLHGGGRPGTWVTNAS